MSVTDYKDWADWMRRHGRGLIAEGERPRIVTLCGSTRFAELFYEWGKSFTLKGHIVLSIEVTTTQAEHDDPQFANPAMKEMLDLLHFEKIKMSDFIFVINKDGYIGESTQREIEFALEEGIPIEYLEEDKAPHEEDIAGIQRYVSRHER